MKEFLMFRVIKVVSRISLFFIMFRRSRDVSLDITLHLILCTGWGKGRKKGTELGLCFKNRRQANINARINNFLKRWTHTLEYSNTSNRNTSILTIRVHAVVHFPWEISEAIVRLYGQNRMTSADRGVQLSALRCPEAQVWIRRCCGHPGKVRDWCCQSLYTIHNMASLSLLWGGWTGSCKQHVDVHEDMSVLS